MATLEHRKIVLTPSANTNPAGLSLEDWVSILQSAAGRWNALPCGIRVAVAAPRPFWSAADDELNLVAFRTERWCHNNSCSHTGTFPLRALAMTTTYPEGARGGAVRGADIELNAVNYRFLRGSVLAERTNAEGPRSVPLEPILVHELGHALGLEDACGTGHLGRSREQRAAVSDCPVEHKESVMFAPAFLASPTPTDERALCALFPPRHASEALDASEPVVDEAAYVQPAIVIAIGLLVASGVWRCRGFVSRRTRRMR